MLRTILTIAAAIVLAIVALNVLFKVVGLLVQIAILALAVVAILWLLSRLRDQRGT